MTLAGSGRAWRRRFATDRSGQVAYLFGLMAIPILFAVGAALDYGRHRSTKVRLDTALDAAILSVAARKTPALDQGAVQRSLDAHFRAQAATITSVVIPAGEAGFKVRLTQVGTNLKVTADYRAMLATSAFTRLMGFDAMGLDGSATAQRGTNRFMDFHLLLDNSPSMGLAATQADEARLRSLTRHTRGTGAEGCAFACHERSYLGSIAIGDDLGSYYFVAKRNDVRLRIDTLREAAQSLINVALADQVSPGQFRMSLHTFSDNVVDVAPLTTNLDSVKLAAQTVDLEYATQDHRNNQTSYIRALPKIAEVIPVNGSGASATSPMQFLFLITDGVQNAPWDTGKALIPPYEKQTLGQRFNGPMDPNLCKPLKDRGVRIGIIHTAYLPQYEDWWYRTFIMPFEAVVDDKLKACASEGMYYPVSWGGDVSAALHDLFKQATNNASVRLTD